MWKHVFLIVGLLASFAQATVTITTTKTGELDCDGSTTEFAFSFPYSTRTEIRVDVITDAADVATRQTYLTDYTVYPSYSTSGGTVTMLTAPADGNYIVISRTTSVTQDADIDAGAYTSRTSIEDALDEIYRILQEHDDAITRSIRSPQEEVTTDMVLSGALTRASTYVMFSATGALTLGTAFVPTTASVSSFMETVLDDNTAAAARTTLGAYGSADSPTFTNVSVTGSIEPDIVHISDAASVTINDSDSGQDHLVPDLSQDTTFNLPAEIDHLHYRFVYVGGATETHDWIIDTGSNTNYFKGGIVQHDPDVGGDDTAVYNSDGNSNSKITIYTPEQGTVIEMWCDGTNWYVTGTVISATDTGVAFADQS